MENSSESGCSNFNKCYEILKLMVDNQATSEQEKYFTDHIENCIHCLKEYNLEQEVKQMIKTLVHKKSVPSGLIETIRTAIISTP